MFVTVHKLLYTILIMFTCRAGGSDLGNGGGFAKEVGARLVDFLACEGNVLGALELLMDL
jgi:hypothetical protein